MFAYLLCATAIATPIELPTTNVTDPQNIEQIVTLSEEKEINPDTIVVTEKKLITITNSIQPNMLAYKHWTGTYNPDKFTVFVNDTEIAQGAEIKIPAATQTVNLRFDYSFVSGARKGTKTVSYKLNDNITQANITFSWQDDNKIIIDNSTIIAT